MKLGQRLSLLLNKDNQVKVNEMSLKLLYLQIGQGKFRGGKLIVVQPQNTRTISFLSNISQESLIAMNLI